jgi:hypothetical protein
MGYGLSFCVAAMPRISASYPDCDADAFRVHRIAAKYPRRECYVGLRAPVGTNFAV